MNYKLVCLVTELDRPWLETPFLIQGFHIHDTDDIDKLREYCEFVYVENECNENKYTPTCIGKKRVSIFAKIYRIIHNFISVFTLDISKEITRQGNHYAHKSKQFNRSLHTRP